MDVNSLLQDIPRLQWTQRNEARRLVTLLDTLYDMRCHLHCSAAGKPHQVSLFISCQDNEISSTGVHLEDRLCICDVSCGLHPKIPIWECIGTCGMLQHHSTKSWI